MKRSHLLTGAAALLSLFVCPGLTQAAQISIQIGQRGNRLEGDRFETMRSLAHYLDQGVQYTLEEATIALASSRNGRDRAFVNALSNFARRADSFHRKMDSYRENPWDVDSDVRNLLGEARRTNDRMRRISAVRDLYDDWASVVDDVNRMQRLLAGEDVGVGPAHAAWEAREGHDHGARGDEGREGLRRRGSDDAREYRTRRLTGQDLAELRELSHDLDTQARRALKIAERDQTGRSRANAPLLEDLRHFVSQTASLHQRTDAERLDRRDFGSVVNHLLDDARAADRSMRDARLFTDAGDEWQETIRILERMDAIVHG
jgi:hypothetical protein